MSVYFSTVVPIGDTVNKEPNIVNETRRKTSWLFTKRAGVEFRATEDKSIQWQGGGLEPGTSGLQVQRPKPLGHARLLQYFNVVPPRNN